MYTGTQPKGLCPFSRMATSTRNAGFYSLFAKFNKKKGSGDDEKQEGLIESLGELTLEDSDEDLLALTKSWDLLYTGSKTKARIHDEGDICERYWVGKQFPDTEYENGRRPLTDNIIFEALETMIPQATQQNPEPIVLTDNGEVTPEVPPDSMTGDPGKPALTMKEVGDKIHMSLEYLADVNDLKTTLRQGVRHWAIRFLGCWQVAWNAKEEEIGIEAVNPKDLILDPNAYIQNGEYFGSFIGRRMVDTAQNLITRFPKKAEDIRRECQGKLGSLMGYVQWRTEESVVYTLKDIILLKHKNENWNYDKETKSVDELGNPIKKTAPGQNYFKHPKIPFVFLTVFNMGDEPADKTSLIQQGLVTQDNINKGLKQYDRNVDKINGGIAVNGLMFNKEQAAQVAEAHRQGRTIVTPGDPNTAIKSLDQRELPATVFERIQDDRVRFMQRFGVAGTTTGTNDQEQTVRGKIIEGNQDSTRTGGGVSESLEIAAARIFEQFFQFMYVFWDTPHWVAVAGPDNAQQMIQFQASDIPPGRKIVLKVQNGSMVPQDPLSLYNEAMAEWEGGVSDPLSYFEKTKDPNPLDRATKLMAYRTNPQQYMAEFLQMQPQIPAQPLPEGGGGSTSGAPPSSVPPPGSIPSPVQMQENSLIKSVPLPK